MAKKLYAVLGLGIFGSTVAKTLSEYGHDVLAIDQDITCVERLDPFVATAVQADITNLEQLRHIGVGDVDVAILGTGSRLEDSLLAVINLKELGVPYIVAKAKNKAFMSILQKVGVDKIIRPEKETGERVAKSLMSTNIIDLIDIDDRYSVVEMFVPKSWVGMQLKDLDVRNRYSINIIGIRKLNESILSISPAPTYVFMPEDHMLVVADTKQLEQLDFLGKMK